MARSAPAVRATGAAPATKIPITVAEAPSAIDARARDAESRAVSDRSGVAGAGGAGGAGGTG